MKKIIFCIAFAIIAMITAAASFVVNDITAYRTWATTNHPKIMEAFGHKDKKDKDRRPPAMRDSSMEKNKNKDKDHHNDRHAPPPPSAPAPAPDKAPEAAPVPAEPPAPVPAEESQQ